MCLQFAIPAASGQVGAAPGAHAAAATTAPGATGAQQTATCILAGNDIVGDVLANYLGATGLAVDRIYEGSYNALVDVYRGRAHIALAHLYDGATDSYNVETILLCARCASRLTIRSSTCQVRYFPVALGACCATMGSELLGMLHKVGTYHVCQIQH